LNEFPVKQDEKLCRMRRKWINEKDFLRLTLCFVTHTVCLSLLWLPEENLSWFSVLPYIAKL